MERPGWRKERRETEAHARGKHFAILRPRTRATADIRATVPRAQLPTGGHVTGVHGIVCLWPAAHTQPSLEDPVVSAYMSALRDLVLSPTLYFLSSFLPSNFMWMDSSFLYLSFWGLDIECSPPCPTDKKKQEGGEEREGDCVLKRQSMWHFQALLRLRLIWPRVPSDALQGGGSTFPRPMPSI